MKYFKIQYGYSPEDFISITDAELDKALYAQIVGAVAIFDNGSVKGQSIISITPDWHKAMGWNYEFKMQPEDFEEIEKTVGQEYKGFIGKAKDRVSHLISKGKENLIGKVTDDKYLLE